MMTEDQACNLCIAVIEQTKKDYMACSTPADFARIEREIRQSMFFSVVTDPEAVIKEWRREYNNEHKKIC